MSAFPPAWVKTAEDYKTWLAAEVQEALDDPRPSLTLEEFSASTQAFLDDCIKERASRARASA